jgi:hypothetical protein
MIRSGRSIRIKPLTKKEAILFISIAILCLVISFLSASCRPKKPIHNPTLPRCEEWVCRGDFTYNTVGKDCNCLED